MTQARILVCGPDSYFVDDVATTCAGCAAAIVHRPHKPPDVVLLCPACAGALLAANVAAGEPVPTIAVTPETAREVEAFEAFTNPKGGSH
jgi:hypothetical protein